MTPMQLHILYNDKNNDNNRTISLVIYDYEDTYYMFVSNVSH